MTQEEKFEEAKRLYETANADQRYVLESLFPELKESEDEKIRKELIETIHLAYDCGCSLNKEQRDKYLAWLEKQGQKSAWSEKYIADVFEKVGLAKIVREQSNDNLTNALQDAMIELSKFIPRPKQEWSEEDNRMCKAVIDNIKAICKEGYFVGDISSDKLINWVKDLIERVQPQPKQEWSEEDEHRINDTIYFLETAKKHYASTVELDACIDWHKSLKDRYTWKPSDEQIKALETTLYTNMSRNDERYSVLSEFVAELKKLKG